MHVFPPTSKSAFFSPSPGGFQSSIHEPAIQLNVDSTTTPSPAAAVFKKQGTPKKNGNEKSKLKPNFKARRRGGVRSKKKRVKNVLQSNKQIMQFSILGTNAAGLKAKTDSLNHVIKTLNYPSCVTIFLN